LDVTLGVAFNAGGALIVDVKAGLTQPFASFTRIVNVPAGRPENTLDV
jgi:hypothetical protein